MTDSDQEPEAVPAEPAEPVAPKAEPAPARRARGADEEDLNPFPPRPTTARPATRDMGPRPGRPGPDVKADAFKVIRAAPPPPVEGPGVGVVIAVLVLVVGVVGAIALSRRNPKTPPPPPSTTTARPTPVLAPDFVMEQIATLETVAGARKALDRACELHASGDYAGASNLAEAIRALEAKLGLAPTVSSGDPIEQRLQRAQALYMEQRFDECIEAARAVAADATQPSTVARAMLLSAQCQALRGDETAMEADLRVAEQVGLGRSTTDQVRRALRR